MTGKNYALCLYNISKLSPGNCRTRHTACLWESGSSVIKFGNNKIFKYLKKLCVFVLTIPDR